jgi:hypothetical protein
MAGYEECLRDMRNAYTILIRNPEGQRQLVKHIRKEGYMRSDLEELIV